MGAPDPPRFRIKVGFRFVVLLVGEEVSVLFFFLTEVSVLLTDGKSMRAVRLSVFVADLSGGGESAYHQFVKIIRTKEVYTPSLDSLRPFLRIVPLSPEDFEE